MVAVTQVPAGGNLVCTSCFQSLCAPGFSCCCVSVFQPVSGNKQMNLSAVSMGALLISFHFRAGQ